MTWLGQIAAAVAAFFGWKTKVAPTPQQSQIQTARDEYHENQKHVEAWMRGSKPDEADNSRR
jgi:hypothetical protein